MVEVSRKFLCGIHSWLSVKRERSSLKRERISFLFEGQPQDEVSLVDVHAIALPAFKLQGKRLRRLSFFDRSIMKGNALSGFRPDVKN